MLRTAPPTLDEIQAPVRERLDHVVDEIRRVVVSDFAPIGEVNEYLTKIRGKLFRPALLLLADDLGGRPSDEAANAMTVGEMRQLSSCDALDFSEDEYYRLIQSKTASLMAAACELGALTGAPAHRDALRRFGWELGMAFQIADDLLDYTADSADTGKPSGLDLREHKVTLPLIATLPTLSRTERREMEAFFRDPEPTDDAIAAIVALATARGGLDYARDRALECAARATDALEGLPEGPALDALRDSIAYAIERRR